MPLALLRGVMPVGSNRIPKMAYLREILTASELQSIQTYIQSGNIIFETSQSDNEASRLIHETIKEKIGADLAVIIKESAQFERAVFENPFSSGYDSIRVHLVFTNDDLPAAKCQELTVKDFGDEELTLGSECFCMYLPRTAQKKRLTTNYLEKQLGIKATMRKLSLAAKLSQFSCR
ncbi:DUF1697 domain-containing protein [Streptococcus pantholopis]|uniref:DUF1697 domain-containing protein n=1 Tax=Streptococcus pantholopis TaxID=1811193 RepID=A0A172Q5A7_9STRE|nr:DUF1697 domain-containing protein [Streptococcus pantholopis]AND78605.1 hypothetical protein A0O21_00480 [Streptococcus pantholopis]